MIAFAWEFDPSRDHADWSADALGIIGDSSDGRYTYVRSMFEPDTYFVIDWHAKWPDG